MASAPSAPVRSRSYPNPNPIPNPHSNPNPNPNLNPNPSPNPDQVHADNDLSAPPYRAQPSGLYDAIITDPPYGVREMCAPLP